MAADQGTRRRRAAGGRLQHRRRAAEQRAVAACGRRGTEVEGTRDPILEERILESRTFEDHILGDRNGEDRTFEDPIFEDRCREDASGFGHDQRQIVPLSGGNRRRRALSFAARLGFVDHGPVSRDG